MEQHIDTYIAEVMREATGKLVLLDLLDSACPIRPNAWSEQAMRLRASLDRLQAEQYPTMAHSEPSPTPFKR